ncbi:MAG: hypothetical protein K1X55_13230 [Chitinophagales bacterium]|nr:hypothetical protein [Chitinophagales bacterium]
MSEIQQRPKEFVKLLEDFSALYLRVKERVLLAENFYGSVILDTINELRNSFDHIMRATLSQDFELAKKEILRAESHLFRVSFDCYELIGLYVFDEIEKLLRPYTYDIINAVIPTYYPTIRPRLTKLKIELTNCRKNKINPITGANMFEEYENAVVELLDILTTVETSIPELIRNNKIKKAENLKWLIIIPIIIGITVFFATWGFAKFLDKSSLKEDKKELPTQNTSK